MRIGVSSYSFAKLVGSGILTETDIPRAASDLGFEFIEFAEIHPPEGEDRIGYAGRLRAACDSAGLRVENYAVGADFLSPEGSEERTLDRLTEELGIARILGSPRMRHDVANGHSHADGRFRHFDAEVEFLARCCRKLTERAQAFGIRTSVENHGYFCQDSARVERLVSTVDHPNFGILADIGNFLCVDEPPAEALGRLAPSVCHVHVKDFHFQSGPSDDAGEGWFPTRAGNRLRGAIVGHGCVPVRQCLSVLQRAGYDGDLALEFEGLEDPRLALRIGLANVRRILS